jgi:hypothetical protein
MAPTAASEDAITNTVARIRTTSMPARRAASRLPPTA